MGNDEINELKKNFNLNNHITCYAKDNESLNLNNNFNSLISKTYSLLSQNPCQSVMNNSNRAIRFFNGLHSNPIRFTSKEE